MSEVQSNLQHKNRGEMVPTFWLCIWSILFAAQNPLEGISPIFKYLDELCAVCLIGVVLWKRKSIRSWLSLGWVKVMLAALAVFFVAGIAGNVIYQYQPWRYVLVDILTNAKFYMVLISSTLVFSEGEIRKNAVRRLVRWLSAALFAVFVIDRIFVIWPGQLRMGIPSAMLFYSHPTYLAGAMAFLLSLLLVFYVPKNLPFILMDLTVMSFTMRMKAIGGAAVFVALLIWVIWLGKKVKLWYLACAASTVVLLAWKQIWFYFFTFSHNARAVLTKTAFRIFADYFPIGTGFGAYASHIANVHYSPVYERYGFLTDYLIPPTKNEMLEYLAGEHQNFIYQIGEKYFYNELGPKSAFLDDTFWPIVIGQTGFIGTIAYLLVIGILFIRLWKLQSEHHNLFAGGMFVLAYILIASTSEPAFNNAVTIPLAMVLGFCLSAEIENNKKLKGE